MLTVITPATPGASTWLVDRASVKADLGSTLDDATIDRLIAEATATLARRSDREIWASETVEETLRLLCWQNSIILLRRPVSAIASVIVDGITLAASAYELDGRQLYRLDGDVRIGWSGYKTVVRYTGGYTLPASAPPDLAAACRTLIRQKWFAVDRDPTVKGEEVRDVLRQDYWIGNMPTDDPDGLPAEIAGLCVFYRYS